MKKFLIILLPFLLGSCEDFLDVKPTDQLTEENVFNTESGADLFLNTIYVTLPCPELNGSNAVIDGGLSYDNWDFMSPYNVCRYAWGRTSVYYGTYAYTASEYNPGIYNHMYPSIFFQYNYITGYIRNCNYFIESLEKYKDQYSESWITKRVAEAKCLRAYYYHLLWMYYGGVPYITKVLDTSMGDEMFQPSMSQEDMYKEMTTDLSNAAKVLPNEQGGGRFTKGAALTLKAWIDLYWGDIIKDPRPSSIFPADPQKALDAYKACAETCQEIMGLGVYDLMPTREDAFKEENNNCKEQVFAYQCNKTFPKSRRSKIFGPYNEATGATGDYIGAGAPTQALVDMYGMKNGLPIDDPNSGYDPEHPFENREPRFYADIIYDGSVFTGHKFSLHPESAEELGLVPNEVDWFTGYFRRKGINENLSFADFETEGVNFSFFRYADVLLMYAEARIKAAEFFVPEDWSGKEAVLRLGCIVDADSVFVNGHFVGTVSYQYPPRIYKVPSKLLKKGKNQLTVRLFSYGGRPSLDKLKEIIFNERIVELSFEFKAYTDVRRFRRGDLLNQPKQAIRWDSNQGGYVLKTLSEGNFWDDKLYLIPIYQEWLEKNPAWMDPEKQVDGRTKGQNPGW